MKWIVTATTFTRCRHILEMVKNVMVATFLQPFTLCRYNGKQKGDLAVTNSLHDFDGEEIYLKKQSVSFVNGGPTRHINHRFQNVPASFEDSLNQWRSQVPAFGGQRASVASKNGGPGACLRKNFWGPRP